MTGEVEIVRFDGPEAKRLHRAVVDIYRSAFTGPPFNDSEREVGWFSEEFAADVDLPGFRCFAARVGAELVGFAYGFRTFEDEPWNDWYAEVLRAVGPVVADTWIRSQFAVGWLAVHTGHRGRGIGSRLFDELVASSGPSRCWLVTHDLDTSARRLYHRRGWIELGHGPLGWGGGHRLVLGLERQGPTSPRSVRMRELAPEVTRQRLLIEGYYTADVDSRRVEEYLQGIADHLGLRTYGRPAIFAPAGEGRDENQGFDAFLPLIDSGISLYVWTGRRFIATILFTCRLFDEPSAIEYTRDFFNLSEFNGHAF